jgi:hypothetical protein
LRLRQGLRAGGLAKKLGAERVKQALAYLDQGEWAKVAAMMLDYVRRPRNRPVALTAARSCLGDDICERAVRRFSRLLIVLCVQRTLTNAR